MIRRVIGLVVIVVFCSSVHSYAQKEERLRVVEDYEIKVAAATDTIGAVVATGPDSGTRLEDQVEVSWRADTLLPVNSYFEILRDSVIISIAGPPEAQNAIQIYKDFAAKPDSVYEYCVIQKNADASHSVIGCDEGGRVIKRPTGMQAGDGLSELQVAVRWTDQSAIESGYNLYRDAGNALDFDGTNDYVSMASSLVLTDGFTIEFWATRAGQNTDDYVLNIEDGPSEQSNVNNDLAIGFTSANHFEVSFGNDDLATVDTYTDANWHHWAVTYNAGSQRRSIYRDGVRVASDVVSTPYEKTGIIELGRRKRTGGVSTRGHFVGQIDEIRFWTESRAPEDISAGMTMLLRGTESGLGSYWPMDADAGTNVADVVGEVSGTMVNMTNADWVGSGVADLYRQLDPNTTFFLDRGAVPAFESYTYRLSAFDDADGNGVFDDGIDYVSQERSDDGWRAVVTPPGFLSATDGQFTDRVRINWSDQSSAEDGYNVYRDNVIIGSVPSDSTQFDDLTPLVGDRDYCVRATASGVESVPTCDPGRAGGLAPPADVAATDEEYDDRIQVTWSDTSDTEDGFEVYREGLLLATLNAGAVEYNDFDAAVDFDYEYCVRAFSEADPDNTSYSSQTCTSSDGRRAAILAPSTVTASDGSLEDRVTVSWVSPSSTALLFKIRRAGTLISIIEAGQSSTFDKDITADMLYSYCVSAMTVTGASEISEVKERVSQMIVSAREKNAVSSKTGAPLLAATTVLADIEASFSGTLSKGTGTATEVVESDQVCDNGHRLINPPTDLEASFSEFEGYVQLSWVGSSNVADGFILSRREIENTGATPTPFDTVSANISSLQDDEGEPGQRYKYYVRAFDELGLSTADSADGLRELEAPTAFAASDSTSETEVRLEWVDNSKAESGYRIYRKEMGEADSEYEELDTVGRDQPGYVDVVHDSLLGTRFTYKLAAFDEYGESNPVTDEGNTAILEPSNLHVSIAYEDSVVVVWTDRSEVEDGFRLTRRLVGGSTIEVDSTLASGSTKFIDFPSTASEYEYCVEAFLNQGGGTVPSAEVCANGQKFFVDGGGGGTDLVARQILSTNTDFGRFGFSVAMDTGGHALIGWPGGPGGGSTDGRAVKYSVDISTNVWTAGLQYGAELANDESFGSSVDLSGKWAVVGAPDGDDVGAFFTHSQDTVTHDEFTSDTNDDDIEMGTSVAISDSLSVVGAPAQDDNNNTSNAGAAWICNVEATECGEGSGWPELHDVDGVPHIAEGFFGTAVDISKGTDTYYAIVGAPGANSAFIFSCDGTAGCDDTEDWTLRRWLTSPFGTSGSFGAAVAIGSTLALVGDPTSEKVQVYERSGTTWNEQEILSPGPSSDGFGAAVAIRDDDALIGAPLETFSGTDEAGAAYAFNWDSSTDTWSSPTRYDARVAGTPEAYAHFGTSVAVGEGIFVVGAPDEGGSNRGATYAIPFSFEASNPVSDELAPPSNVRVSDGSPDDRIRIRWDDQSTGEDGHYIYRGEEGGVIEQFADVAANVEFYDDFEATAGSAYRYCVAAFIGNTTTDQECDIGWVPPNGTIAGSVATTEGAGTEDAKVCLAPSPNRALQFDGAGGYVLIPDDGALDVTSSFTIEAWIKPESVSGERFVLSKGGAYGFGINGANKLRLNLFTIKNYETTLASNLVAGEWYHIAVVLDDSFDAQFYLNGAAAGSPVTGSTEALNTVSPMYIGQEGDGTSFFEGQIDDLRLWNTERSAGEISGLYDNTLVGDEEGLIGYWPLDQGELLVVPDISESANHGDLKGGVYVTEDGGPLDICATTDTEGNFTLSGIRYGESTKFTVMPSLAGRTFTPEFKTITLSQDSPVQNEVGFIDNTAYTIAGFVQYVDVLSDTTLVCPVPDVSMHLDKSPIPNDGNLKLTSGEDGSYALAALPSQSATDLWYVMPEYTNPDNDQIVHTFSPSIDPRHVTASVFDADILNTTRFTFSGHFSGGDPGICGKDIGTATIRIYTEDGCYDRTITADSDVNDGAFTVDLPPLRYLVDIVDIAGTPSNFGDDVENFFEDLGTFEIDLSQGDVARDFVYRAPLVLAITGLEPPGSGAACEAGFVQLDEEGAVVRDIPPVKVIGEGQFEDLIITVMEDYGEDGMCAVDQGTVSIFDGIADRAEYDSTRTIENGEVHYSTYGASANPFGGARVDGVDRSFQKSITAIAQIEGQDPLTVAEWAIVEGQRVRASTFVSATTTEIPMLVVHDPPGDGSSAHLEKGESLCTSILSTTLLGGGAGAEIKLNFGYNSEIGLGLSIENGGGFSIGARAVGGQDVTSLDDDASNNRTICVTTSEDWSTSDDEKFVSDDVYIGAALNLIFAIADDLSVDQASCELSLAEVLANGLDTSDPFATTYVYSESHIRGTLIPMIEQLLDLNGGDATLSGTIDDEQIAVSLQGALGNWRAQLQGNDDEKQTALSAASENISFDGGSQFSYSSTEDTTRTVHFESTRIYIDSEGSVGGLLTLFGQEQEIAAVFEVRREWVTDTTAEEGSSRTVGYTLADDDPGDFFTVDIGTDSRFKTPVFGTVSGRSSNPWEQNTQPRDRARLSINPPVQLNVPEGLPAVFTLTMTNASESAESREYILQTIHTANPGGAEMTANGAFVEGGTSFFLPGDPSRASQEVLLAVYPGPTRADYENLQLHMYPPGEYAVWQDGGVGNNGIIQLADTISFSAYFQGFGNGSAPIVLQKGWNPISVNTQGGNLASVLDGIGAQNGDVLITDAGTSTYDSTLGWSGDVAEILPGKAYRLYVNNPALLVQRGALASATAPIELAKGWTEVGYLPTDTKDINDALASLTGTAVTGDAVVGANGFAQFVEGKGWIGTLRHMAPGQGYRVYSQAGGTLIYPMSAALVADVRTPSAADADAPTTLAESRSDAQSTETRGGKTSEAFDEESKATLDSKANRALAERKGLDERVSTGPQWTVDPARYPSSMALVIDLQDGGEQIQHEGSRIAVMDGDEIRGLGWLRRFDEVDDKLAYVQVYGGLTSEDGRDLLIAVYDGASNEVYDAVGTVRYVPNGLVGTPVEPLVVDVRGVANADAAEELPTEFALGQNYPNPFNPTTTIQYDLPQASVVKLAVFDVLGRHVLTLVDGEQEAGRYNLAFDASQIASGIYFYTIDAGDFTAIRKMMLLK